MYDNWRKYFEQTPSYVKPLEKVLTWFFRLFNLIFSLNFLLSFSQQTTIKSLDSKNFVLFRITLWLIVSANNKAESFLHSKINLRLLVLGTSRFLHFFFFDGSTQIRNNKTTKDNEYCLYGITSFGINAWVAPQLLHFTLWTLIFTVFDIFIKNLS